MAKTKRASQKHVLNLVKIRQDCSLDQTRHELIFFSFAESLGLSFLHLYCLSPKYLARASQHFLPALTEDGCFDFPLKCLIGVGKPSKARGLTLDMHLKGRRLQGLAFLQAVNPRSPLPKDRTELLSLVNRGRSRSGVACLSRGPVVLAEGSVQHQLQLPSISWAAAIFQNPQQARSTTMVKRAGAGGWSAEAT